MFERMEKIRMGAPVSATVMQVARTLAAALGAAQIGLVGRRRRDGCMP
jgi:hypothetical protein